MCQLGGPDRRVWVDIGAIPVLFAFFGRGWYAKIAYPAALRGVFFLSRMQISSSGRRLLGCCLAVIFLFSLWLRMPYPIMAIAAGHDDLLFVRQAVTIGSGDWLGDYNNLTHAKGMAYSLFLLINHLAGLPLKFSEHLIYLLAALYFSATIGRIYKSRVALLATFAALAFLPPLWLAGVGGRVVRENLYVSLSLLLLALGARCWLLPAVETAFGTPGEHLRRKWPQLLALGVIAGLYWLTREEGVWLLPAMAVLAAFWLWQQRRALYAWPPTLTFVLVPLAAAGVVVGAVNALNYAHYGVFRNNDFRSSDFQAGYGALTRIRHQSWQRYVLFPADARQRAYEMSAAARELKPFFEGQVGEFWREIGCTQTETKPCPEVLSGWFMWALRDAVAQAGYYRDAESAQRFYQRLAAEIEAGCQAKPQYCRRERATMVPPWHKSYAWDTLSAARAVFQTLVTFGGWLPDTGKSVGEAKLLAIFQVVTNGPLSPSATEPTPLEAASMDLVSPRDIVRHAVSRWLTQIQVRLATIGVPLALAVWGLWLLATAWRRRAPDAALAVSTALVAALVTRVLLLAFLEATSIPSNNILYLLPVTPMTLALLPVVFWGLLRFVRPDAAGSAFGGRSLLSSEK